MRKTFLIITTNLIFALVSVAIAENIDISGELTLDQCINIALEQSSNIKQAEFRLRSIGLDLDDARANFLPSVDIGGQYEYSRAGIEAPGRDPGQYSLQVSANYTIWDHNRRRTQLAQTKASVKATRADYDKSVQDLIYNITQAYYSILQAEKLVGVDEKLLEISKTSLEKVKAFQEQGKAIPADLSSARVQQASAELTLINAQNNLDLARSDLASMMGLDPGTPIIVLDDPDYKMYTEATLVTGEISLENSIAAAIESRPELRRLKSSLDSQELSLKQAQLNRWPMLASEAGYNISLDDYIRDGGSLKKYRNWSVLGRISFPIFDGGTSKRNAEKAEIALEQMKESISEQERSIILDVQQAYLNFGRAKKNLDIARAQVKDSEDSLNVIQGRYELNMAIFLEVLSAQAQYAQSLTNQVRAFYDYKIADKSLLRAMGTLKVGD